MHQIWIDRGGTFTDCIYYDSDTGRARVLKLLSSDHAPVIGIRRLLSLDSDSGNAPIPPCDVRLGTTLATNALLERQGARSVLVTNRGLEDVFRIGDQSRPELFRLDIPSSQPICSIRGISGRLDATGREIEPLCESGIRSLLEELFAERFRSVAIALLHAHINGVHESKVAAIARAVGFRSISLSHEVAAEMGFLARGQTAAADAYLTPVVRGYAERLQNDLPKSRIRMMQSVGTLCDADRFRGRDAVLSGPAGGVVGMAGVAAQTGLSRVIGFDMGGTSTDVSRFDGSFQRVSETKVAGVRVRVPALTVHTVAAGGGSICRFDGQRLRVGPASAGASPGPLCYGAPRARELTLTDANFALGRLSPERFPIPLNAERVHRRLDEIAQRAGLTPEETAEGFLEVATNAMASAIRKITVSEGVDARDHALVVFGGAGGQFAGRVARQLGIRTLVFHPLSGVLSAFGIGTASFGWQGETDGSQLAWGDSFVAKAERIFEQLEQKGIEELQAPTSALRVRKRLDIRYRGTETTLSVSFGPEPEVRAAFEQLHRRRFGYIREGHEIQVETLRVWIEQRSSPLPRVRVESPPPPAQSSAMDAAAVDPRGTGSRVANMFADGHWRDAPIWHRETLERHQADRATAESTLEGPAMVLEETGTIIVEPGFALEHRDGVIIMRDTREPLTASTSSPPPRTTSISAATTKSTPDPIRLEVLANRFMAIAEHMGAVLQLSALSTNIRDRHDFSCALFDRHGRLVANAPHIPVHLGSMDETLRCLLEDQPDMQPGDVFATNDPYRGGSHLPDVTVITPVYASTRPSPQTAEQTEPLFFVASRAHHADIGGITPGSMPSASRSLEEEGAVLRFLRITQRPSEYVDPKRRDSDHDALELDVSAIRQALARGPYPARRPEDNVADLAAQLAANRRGVALLRELCAEYSTDTISAYMDHIQDLAEHEVRQAIATLPRGPLTFRDAMDDGTEIVATIDVAEDPRVDTPAMIVDFGGTASASLTNRNAPPSVTQACVLYVLRTLVDRPIPLNAGCLRPVEIRAPAGSLLDPPNGFAVVGGNVETSQRVVDVLFGALGVAAASQGTMNNVSFGTAGPESGQDTAQHESTYYETVGGGAGAGPHYAGASAVHTHMTNSRITDAEILESRYPVRLREFSIRRGSGGRGRYSGGDGINRELEFLRDARVSIMSERRTRAPYGLHGGGSGMPGRNTLRRGELSTDLGGSVSVDVHSGDRLRVETPGGGGYGAADSEEVGSKGSGTPE